MKIACDREKLLAAFQTAAAVVPTRSPKPILQNVKLNVKEDTAVVMATDTEIGIRLEVPGIEVSAAGSAVLPTVRFGSILRESSDEKLAIESDGSHVKVKGNHSKFSLSVPNPDEFPEVESYSEEKHHELPARFMKELVRRTLFATDTDSSRYALGGVLLEFSENEITAVGTDGRRLAVMKGPAIAVSDHSSGEAMTIVPARAMNLLDRALSDADAEIQISARTNDVLVKSPRCLIYSRLVEGRFPKWRDVIPSRQDGVKVEIAVGPFHAAVRQAAIVTSEESRGINFTMGNGTLVMTGTTAQVGESRVELPVPYDGSEVNIALDHRYVADFLRVLEPEATVTLDIKDNENAAKFSTEDGYVYVVMPLSREQRR